VIQYPEPTEDKNFVTIADIAKFRIRRVIERKISEAAESLPLNNQGTGDLGFKVFKLVAPNIQPWLAVPGRDPEAYAAKLTMFNDPLVTGWRATDLLWELALREGLSLNTRFDEKKLADGQTVYELSDPDRPSDGGSIAVCLDDKVTVELSKHYPLTPDRVLIVRDVALDDTAAANLALQCRLKVI
jgi:adenine-specific DNA-methyltransferase